MGHTGIQKREGWYPDEKRVEVATLYAVTGNAEAVGELTDVPKSTIRRWVREEWFQSLLDDVRAENDHLLDVKQTEIVKSAMEQLGDRVTNGDHVLLRDGTTVRKPVGAKDLSIISSINIKDRQLLRGKPTSRSDNGSNRTIEDKLSELAENFKKLANRQPLKELEVEDAVILEETTK